MKQKIKEILKSNKLLHLVSKKIQKPDSIIDNETKKRINFAKDISVGNHVWIGAHSIILKGSIIGNNSVVGTSSLVTSFVPPNSIVAGVPAKVIKTNIDWLRELIYDS